MNKSIQLKLLLALSIFLALTFSEAECRGGRGRGGGGTFSLFGGLRKYKKQNSYRSSRKITSGSPMHTAITAGEAKVERGGVIKSLKPVLDTSRRGPSYPKQSYYAGRHGMREMPPGSSYYAQASSIPTGAVFYGQPPVRTGSGDYLFGMVAANVLTEAMFGPRRNVIHGYHQSPTNGENGPKVIIISNGNTADWNSSISSLQSRTTNVSNSSLMSQSSSAEEQDVNVTSATPSIPPVSHGVLCMPVVFNQTSSEDPSRVEAVEKLVCFPAPPPLPQNAKCTTRNIEEPDPSDAEKTLVVQKQECFTEQPVQVAGEIGENGAL